MSTDRILAVLSLLGVIVFLSPVVFMVREPDLIIVIVVVMAMAAYDFYRELWRGPARSR